MSSFWRELLQLIGLWFMHPYFYKWSVMWCLDKLTLFFYTFLVCLLNWMLMSWAQSQHLCQLVNFSSVAIIVELSFTQIWNVISAGILVFNLNARFFWYMDIVVKYKLNFVFSLCVCFIVCIFFFIIFLCPSHSMLVTRGLLQTRFCVICKTIQICGSRLCTFFKIQRT